jgi:hypothetical protein
MSMMCICLLSQATAFTEITVKTNLSRAFSSLHSRQSTRRESRAAHRRDRLIADRAATTAD